MSSQKMEVAVNKLMHFFKASPSTIEGASIEGRLGFIKTYWELEKIALLRVPDAMQAAIYLGLPFSQYEWGGILPLVPGAIIRLIPDKYPVDGYPPSSAIMEMAGYGNDEGVAAFVEVFDPGYFQSVDFKIAMSKAMRFGHAKCVEILKHYCTPDVEDFKKAAAFGHAAVISETIEYMTREDAVLGVVDAARFGHGKTVDVILESCGAPADMLDKAYRAAKSYGHTATMSIIKRYSDDA